MSSDDHTPETFPNNQGLGGDKTPDVQPTPESNIKDQEPLGELMFDLHTRTCDPLEDSGGAGQKECAEHKASVYKEIQALLTAADQAGYTRGRVEGAIAELKRKVSLHIEDTSSIKYIDGFNEALSQLAKVDKLRIAELQKEADNG